MRDPKRVRAATLTIRFTPTFKAESGDQAPWGNRYTFKTFLGMDPAPFGDTGANMAVTTQGYKPLHFYLAQVSQLGPEATPGGGVPETVAEYCGTMSLMCLRFPDLAGNIFAWVRNGEDGLVGPNGSIGPTTGGSYAAVYQELWGGRPALAQSMSKISGS